MFEGRVGALRLASQPRSQALLALRFCRRKASSTGLRDGVDPVHGDWPQMAGIRFPFGFKIRDPLAIFPKFLILL